MSKNREWTENPVTEDGYYWWRQSIGNVRTFPRPNFFLASMSIRDNALSLLPRRARSGEEWKLNGFEVWSERITEPPR